MEELRLKAQVSASLVLWSISGTIRKAHRFPSQKGQRGQIITQSYFPVLDAHLTDATWLYLPWVHASLVSPMAPLHREDVPCQLYPQIINTLRPPC